MTRLLVLLVVSATCLAAPSLASACCADIDRTQPLGWSEHGHLLVERLGSRGCEGTSTAEVLRPGRVRASDRFDLYDGARRLGPGAEARYLTDEELYEASQVEDGEDLFPAPQWLTSRFAVPVATLCAGSVLATAEPNPADPADVEHWDARVRLSVAVMTTDGFHEVLSDLVIPRWWAEEADVFVHPSPAGRRAVVRIHLAGSELFADQIHWVTLPELAPPGGGCEGAAGVIPSADVAAQEYFDDYYLDSGLEILAGHGGEEEPPRYAFFNLARALWSQPGDPMLRAHVVHALEALGRLDVAAVVGAELDLDVVTEAALALESLPVTSDEPADIDLEIPVEKPELELDGELGVAIPWASSDHAACDGDGGCPLPGDVPVAPPGVPASCSASGGASAFDLAPALAFVAAWLGLVVARRRGRAQS